VGASPLFPPQYANEGVAKRALLLVVRREPRTFGYARSRWKLALIAQECAWLKVSTESSVCRLLKRLGIHYKRGRDYIRSPDRHYQDKLSLIELAKLRAYYAPERFVCLYVDEFSYYRQPTVAPDYETKGTRQPLAHRSHRSNTCFRVIGALNAVTGQVNYRQRNRISRLVLSDFWAQLRLAYPHVEVIYVVIDNWPVHFHPDALARLQPQSFPWPPYVPPNWPHQPDSKAVQDDLPIELLCLPTYASWLNPIEKLWRWLQQDELHMHRCSADWAQLKLQVATFLDQFQSGSDDLLHYVGLLPN